MILNQFALFDIDLIVNSLNLRLDLIQVWNGSDWKWHQLSVIWLDSNQILQKWNKNFVETINQNWFMPILFKFGQDFVEFGSWFVWKWKREQQKMAAT